MILRLSYGKEPNTMARPHCNNTVPTVQQLLDPGIVQSDNEVWVHEIMMYGLLSMYDYIEVFIFKLVYISAKSDYFLTAIHLTRKTLQLWCNIQQRSIVYLGEK